MFKMSGTVYWEDGTNSELSLYHEPMGSIVEFEVKGDENHYMFIHHDKNSEKMTRYTNSSLWNEDERAYIYKESEKKVNRIVINTEIY